MTNVQGISGYIRKVYCNVSKMGERTKKKKWKKRDGPAQYCCFSSSSIGRGALQTCEIFEKVLNFSEQDI